jgi:hypothetical protein
MKQQIPTTAGTVTGVVITTAEKSVNQHLADSPFVRWFVIRRPDENAITTLLRGRDKLIVNVASQWLFGEILASPPKLHEARIVNDTEPRDTRKIAYNLLLLVSVQEAYPIVH